MKIKQTPQNSWTFLSNHSHVLLCLASDSTMRMRDIATRVGITERAVQRIIADLHESGYIERHKEGRCNTYRINFSRELRHPLEKHRMIEDLISLICPEQLPQ
jgi:predicted ArsR family transcriptional regulator